MQRWLLVYQDMTGAPKVAVIAPREANKLPFGVDLVDLGIEDNDPMCPAVLVQMPADAEFRPDVIDIDAQSEVAMSFIDL